MSHCPCLAGFPRVQVETSARPPGPRPQVCHKPQHSPFGGKQHMQPDDLVSVLGPDLPPPPAPSVRPAPLSPPIPPGAITVVPSSRQIALGQVEAATVCSFLLRGPEHTLLPVRHPLPGTPPPGSPLLPGPPALRSRQRLGLSANQLCVKTIPRLGGQVDASG